MISGGGLKIGFVTILANASVVSVSDPCILKLSYRDAHLYSLPGALALLSTPLSPGNQQTLLLEMVLKKSTLNRIGGTFVGANFGKTLAFRPMIIQPFRVSIENRSICKKMVAWHNITPLKNLTTFQRALNFNNIALTLQ